MIRFILFILAISALTAGVALFVSNKYKVSARIKQKKIKIRL